MVSLGLPLLIRVTLGLPLRPLFGKKVYFSGSFWVTMKEGPGQKPIKVNADLWAELDGWLKTRDAKKMGYYSKAQFTTEAVRLLLDQYRVTSIKLSEELLEQLTNEYEQTTKGSKKKNISFDEYVNSRIKQGIRPDKRTQHRT